MLSATTLTAFSPPVFVITRSTTFFNVRRPRNPVFRRRPNIRASYQTGKIKTSIRVFLDHVFISGQSITLDPSELRHLRARRARDGDVLLLFNKAGYTATAVLHSPHANVLQVSKTKPQPLSITAIIGIPKSPSRTDWIVEKLTELGVASIVFTCTARTTRRLSDERINRWRRLAVAATKQSLRTEMPHISVMPFQHVLNKVQQHAAPLLFCSGGQSILADECANVVKASSSALLLVGPEGGFDDVETDALVHAGAIKVGLGDLRLRVETAAVVAAGVVSQLFLHANCSSEMEPR